MSLDEMKPAELDPALDGDCESCGQELWSKPRGHCRRRARHVCGARHGRAVARCERRKLDCDRERAQARRERREESFSKLALSAGEVDRALRSHYVPYPPNWSWAFLDEFRVGVGHEIDVVGHDISYDEIRWERRIDLLAVNCWPKRGLSIIAHEIKVDRGDLLRELKDPDKRSAAQTFCTQFYFATPSGLMNEDELPEDCGLLEVDKTRRGRAYVTEIVEAPLNPVESIHWRTFASLAQRVATAEGSMRR